MAPSSQLSAFSLGLNLSPTFPAAWEEGTSHTVDAGELLGEVHHDGDEERVAEATVAQQREHTHLQGA